MQVSDTISAQPTPAIRPATGADGDHITYCRICEAQCGLIANVRNGRVEKIGPDRNHPVSQGHLCVKGVNMTQVTYDPDRILVPQRRTGGPGEFEPVSWDEALDDIAKRLKAVIEKHGGESVGVYFGNPPAFSTLHAGYIFGFAGALGASKAFNSIHVDIGAKLVACLYMDIALACLSRIFRAAISC